MQNIEIQIYLIFYVLSKSHTILFDTSSIISSSKIPKKRKNSIYKQQYHLIKFKNNTVKDEQQQKTKLSFKDEKTKLKIKIIFSTYSYSKYNVAEKKHQPKKIIIIIIKNRGNTIKTKNKTQNINTSKKM